jgi:hypothetical protein
MQLKGIEEWGLEWHPLLPLQYLQNVLTSVVTLHADKYTEQILKYRWAFSARSAEGDREKIKNTQNRGVTGSFLYMLWYDAWKPEQFIAR